MAFASLVVDETRQFQAVLEHPAFVADPIAAIQEHLKNTVGQPSSAGGGGGKKKKGKGKGRM